MNEFIGCVNMARAAVRYVVSRAFLFFRLLGGQCSIIFATCYSHHVYLQCVSIKLTVKYMVYFNQNKRNPEIITRQTVRQTNL